MFNELSNDLISYTFHFLSPNQITSCVVRVCKQWNTCANNNYLWKLFSHQYAEYPIQLNKENLSCQKYRDWKSIYCRMQHWNHQNPQLQNKTKEEIIQMMIARAKEAQTLGLYSAREDIEARVKACAQTDILDLIVSKNAPISQFASTEHFEILIATGFKLVKTFSLLHTIAKYYDYTTLRLIQKRGVTEEDQSTFLNKILAQLVKNDDQKNVQLINTLITEGFSFKDEDNYNHRPIDIVAKTNLISIAQLLIERGALVNTTNSQYNTPLHQAASTGCLSMIELFVKNGANIHALNQQKCTALHTALLSEAANEKTALLLVELGSSIDSVNIEKETPLYLALKRGYKIFFNKLLEKGCSIRHELEQGICLLHAACYGGSQELVEFIIKSGSDPCQVDPFGYTPLHYACLNNQVNMIGFLMDHYKISINHQNKDGNTPLHCAVMYHYAESVEILLHYKPDVSIKNKEGKIAIQLLLGNQSVKQLNARNIITLLVQSPSKLEKIKFFFKRK